MTYHKSDTLTPSDDGAKALGQRKYTNNWNMYHSSKNKWLPPLALVSSKYRTIPMVHISFYSWHFEHSTTVIARLPLVKESLCCWAHMQSAFLPQDYSIPGLARMECWNGHVGMAKRRGLLTSPGKIIIFYCLLWCECLLVSTAVRFKKKNPYTLCPFLFINLHFSLSNLFLTDLPISLLPDP